MVADLVRQREIPWSTGRTNTITSTPPRRKGEIDRGDAMRALVRAVGPKTPERAFRLALEWVLHRDPLRKRAARAKEQALHAQHAAKQRELDEEARRRRRD